MLPSLPASLPAYQPASTFGQNLDIILLHLTLLREFSAKPEVLDKNNSDYKLAAKLVFSNICC
jgi:hypothetical protein